MRWIAIVAVIIAVAILAAVRKFSKVLFSNGLRPPTPEPCGDFRAQAQNPTLVPDITAARALLGHIQTCRSCDKALQKAMDQAWHYSAQMFAIWNHLAAEQVTTVSHCFLPRVNSPITEAEYHAAFCHRCGGKVRK